MNNTGFTLIYSAGLLYEAELIAGLLDEHGIEAIIMNKRDSELLIGDVEIYVANADAENAFKIIANK